MLSIEMKPKEEKVVFFIGATREAREPDSEVRQRQAQSREQ